jgi:hypothetical protein
VSTETAPSSLDNTVTARWRAGLVGSKPVEKTHWRTKIAYYKAVSQLLTTDSAQPLTWKTIVDAVRPRGSRSTFYEVTGPRAKHPLVALLRASDSLDTAQLGIRYTRSTPVDQLVDETKVYRYWPYRSAWLHQYELTPDLGTNALMESLVSVLAEWVRCNRGLAAALDFAPPVCAVEDLLVVSHGRLSAVRAYAIFVKAVQQTVHAPADLTDAAADAVRADLGIIDGRVPSPDALLVGLAEQIYAMRRETLRLTPEDAAAVWHVATDLMRDVVAATA